MGSTNSNHTWTFHAVPDIFHDFTKDPTYDPETTKVITQPLLGLVPRAYPSDDEEEEGNTDKRAWTRFAAYVNRLNEEAPGHVRYKVLYLTRHGLGFHNLKHVEVGRKAWDEYWSLETTDGVTTWFDSLLAPQGEQQAHTLHTTWLSLLTQDNLPFPQTFYTSPLARCLQTTQLVFEPLPQEVPQQQHRPFTAIIKENLRERWTLHTCDQRRTRSWIHDNWSSAAAASRGASYLIEDGFQEEDQLGRREQAETEEEHTERKHRVLEDIFETDENQFLSLTVHSYAIRALFAACHAAPFRVREGSSVALLVKGEKLI